jgi:hypothetical protein
MVPRSHSRATTIAVSSVPIRVMMMAISPGTRKLRLRTSGLNHTRCSMATGGFSVPPWSSAESSSHFCQTPSTYPLMMRAVLASDPLTMSWIGAPSAEVSGG